MKKLALKGKKTVATGAPAKGKQGMTIWLTGLPASGKSTIAGILSRKEYLNHVDGDTYREMFTPELGYSMEDRETNLISAATFCKTQNDNGQNVVAAFISPTQKLRDKVKEIIGPDNYYEVHVKASVDECIKRDPKGMYAKALAGEIADFTGVDSEYEDPTSPDFVVDTEKQAPAESAHLILNDAINLL